MLIIFVRCIILYFALLVTMRLMGKRQLGELQPFEFAITLIIADVASIPMQDTAIPILHGIVPILTIFILHLIICKINFKSVKIRKIIDGKPTIIVDSNGINYKNMKSLNMHINDLMVSLRGLGYFSLNEVNIAIVETNGKLSVLPKFANTEVTNCDLKIDGEDKSLPYSLILEGKIMKDTISHFNKLCEKDVVEFVKSKNLKPKDIYLFSIDKSGEYYLQAFKEKPITGSISL